MYKPWKSFIDLEVTFDVWNTYCTSTFYGDSLSNWILEINEVSEPQHPKLVGSSVLGIEYLESPYMQVKMGGDMEVKMGGDIYLWTVRLEEHLKSSWDYEVILDVHSYVDCSGIVMVSLPQQVKTIIGNYCNPIIASGFIVLK